MSSNFNSAVEIILSHEGGYVNDKEDPGGETKFGISKRAYPKLDIKELTRDQAKQIYKNDYWNKIRGDNLSFGVGLMMFDMAVNMGIGRAIKMLQKVVSVSQDGVFGDRTLAAANAHAKAFVLEGLAVERISHYSSLPTWGRFGEGWTRRTIEVLSTGLLMRE